MENYIPLLAYTMYDGYYIYSPEGKEGKKILRPYSPYSARYKTNDGKIDITVNYTLDNYVKIYGKVNEEYQTKEGYLVVCDEINGVKDINTEATIDYGETGIITPCKISDMKYVEKAIEPEELKEKVYYRENYTKDAATGVETWDDKFGVYNYVYDQNNNKVYWDSEWVNEDTGNKEGNFFTVNGDYTKKFLDTSFNITNLNSNKFRKISLPIKVGSEWKILKVYQPLNKNGRNKMLKDIGDTGTLSYITGYEALLTNAGYIISDLADKDKLLIKDFSAINYCTESYVFTQWVKKYLSDIIVSDCITEEGEYNDVDSTAKIFNINKDNNPDPEATVDYEKSIFAIHKKDVIINKLENNFARSVEYSNNQAYDYRIPKLTYNEWEQALSNVSIIAFMQGMPIGLKYYNNYVVVSSTLNGEWVDPQELYFTSNDDEYYHQRSCGEMQEGKNYVGYRATDYVRKTYLSLSIDAEGNLIKKDKYYYLHDDSDTKLECYNCCVNRATYNDTDNYNIAYYNCLARERYLQLGNPTLQLEKPKITLTKTVDHSKVYYEADGTPPKVKFTVTATNDDENNSQIIYLIDYYTGGADGETYSKGFTPLENTIKVKIGSRTVVDGGVIVDSSYFISNHSEFNKGASFAEGARTGLALSNCILSPKETLTLTYEAQITSKEFGSSVINTVVAYSHELEGMIIDKKDAKVEVEKKIKINPNGEKAENSDTNIILVVDTSWSITNRDKLKAVVNTLLTENMSLYEGYEVDPFNKTEINTYNPKNRIWVIQFDASAKFVSLTKSDSDLEIKRFNFGWGGTDYYAAFELVYKIMNLKNAKNNKVIFISDGAPTLLQYNGSDTGIDIIDVFVNLGLDALSTIVGGWLEVAKINTNKYSARLSLVGLAEGVVNIVNNFIKKINNFKFIRDKVIEKFESTFNISNEDAKSILEIICEKSWGYFPKPLAEVLVWNGIENRVNLVKAPQMNTEVYGIYFDTTNTPIPAYGVEWISSNYSYSENTKVSSDYFTHVTNGDYDKLFDVAKGYVENNKQLDSIVKATNEGKIIVDSKYEILDVKINGESYKESAEIRGNTIEFTNFDPNDNIEVIVKENK